MPQTPAAAVPGADGAMPAADIPVNSAPVTWTTPSTWRELAPTSIRIGNFLVKGEGEAKAEVAIFSFPGTVGTELDNVNRWRNEVKLPPIGEGKIESAPVTVDSLPGKLYEINGPAARSWPAFRAMARPGSSKCGATRMLWPMPCRSIAIS